MPAETHLDHVLVGGIVVCVNGSDNGHVPVTKVMLQRPDLEPSLHECSARPSKALPVLIPARFVPRLKSCRV